jgi:hypothetical protein
VPFVPYEPTPVEPTQQPPAYDHLPPYTSLAPLRNATTPPPPAMEMAARTMRTPQLRRRLGTSVVVITVVLILLAVLTPLLASPAQTALQNRANTPTFSVTLLEGGTMRPLRDPSMVLLVESSSGETFTVWAFASAAVPTCDAEVAQRTAGLAGTRATVTSYLVVQHHRGELALELRPRDPSGPRAQMNRVCAPSLSSMKSVALMTP